MLLVIKGFSMLTSRLFPSFIVIVGFSLMEAREAAGSPRWVPAAGTLTTRQDTDIRLASQELAASELRQITIGEMSVWVMDVEARYCLRNTSKAKKKPTIMFPVCRTTESLPPDVSCDLKKHPPKVRVDKRPVSVSYVKQNNIVYARFSSKFGSRQKRDVEISFRHIENESGWNTSDEYRPYVRFDYNLAPGGIWQSKVGISRIRVKVPYKADAFNTRVLAPVGKTERNTAFVTWTAKPFDPEPDDIFTFVSVKPVFKYKVDLYKKKLNKNPKSAVRQFGMARLLAPYTPAIDQTTAHLRIAVNKNKKLKKWDAEKRKSAVRSYAALLAYKYQPGKDSETCDNIICDNIYAVKEITQHYCRSNESCITDMTETAERCCGASTAKEAPGGGATVSKDTAGGPPDATVSEPRPSAAPSEQPPSSRTFEEKAFIILVSFIVVVWLVAGVAIVITLRRHRRSQNTNKG
jgi:hypothetical protein